MHGQNQGTLVCIWLYLGFTCGVSGLRAVDHTDKAGNRGGDMSRTIILHTCDNCGKESEWDDNWQWYGSIFTEEWGHAIELCSDACRDAIGDTEKAFQVKYGRKLTSSYYTRIN